MAKFSVVGVTSAGVDFGSYIVLTRLFNLQAYYAETSVVTSVLAMTTGYLLNRKWTFAAQGGNWREYIKYFGVYGAGIVLQNALLVLLVEWGNVADWQAKTGAIVAVGFGWNFLLAKLWVFRKDPATNTASSGENKDI